MNVGKLQDRVAVVTGAAGGLGAEAARVFAAHGAKIAVVDINNQAAEKVANDICAKGSEAIAVETDISQEASVKSMSEQVVARFWTNRYFA